MHKGAQEEVADRLVSSVAGGVVSAVEFVGGQRRMEEVDDGVETLGGTGQN